MARTKEEKDFVLNRAIPRRLDGLRAMAVAVDMRIKKDPDDDGHFSLTFGGREQAAGNAVAVMDSWLENGLIHGRALLEFLGLWSDGDRLTARGQSRYGNDWRITDFELPSVTPAQAIAAYRGSPEEAEQSLVSIMVFANRAVSHMTDSLRPDRFGSHNLEIASRGIHALVVHNLYTPLGLPEPQSGFKSDSTQSRLD
ncbi:hypothetical protein [Rhodanobacter glycinis]|uniref:hypothetical protein n=1 Tax=Rhodanobacter glycinis TaxID=582702 RepID=UPI001128E002|nr:hypothetical protein [Rhodanobacter glycinis]